MVILGTFAVIGLLSLALHVAKPHVLRTLVLEETRLWWFMPWVTERVLDPDEAYQRAYRRVAVAAITMFTAANLALFAASYL